MKIICLVVLTISNVLCGKYTLSVNELHDPCSLHVDVQTSLPLSGVAYVCPGGLLALTCRSTNAAFQQWSATVPRYPERTETRIISYDGTAQRTSPIIIYSISINVTRTFENEALVSKIFTDNVTADLNGTTVNCTEILRSGTRVELQTRSIHIIEQGTYAGKFQ